MNRSFFSVNNNKRIPRITPVITVLDYNCVTPMQLSMSLGQEDVYTKDHKGSVHMNNQELENNIIELMGTGITMKEMKQYAQRCRELREYANKQNN